MSTVIPKPDFLKIRRMSFQSKEKKENQNPDQWRRRATIFGEVGLWRSSFGTQKLQRHDSEERLLLFDDDFEKDFKISSIKAASLPRNNLVCSTPTSQKEAIEKRLTSIDNLVDYFRRGSPFNGKKQQTASISSGLESVSGDLEDDGRRNLIQITQQEQNERAKEEETIIYKIRKLDEDISLQKDKLEEVKRDFLQLNPRPEQKKRVEASYDKQKQRIKDNIQKLDRKKLKLEGRLKFHSSSENDLQSVDMKQRSNDLNANGFDDRHGDEESVGAVFHLTAKNSSQSLVSADSRSLEESDSGHPASFESINQSDFIQELRNQKENLERGLERINGAIKEFETKKGEFKDELRNLHTVTVKNQKNLDRNEVENAEKLKSIMTEIHDTSDLRAMEHSRLQNELDQVTYRSNERNNDVVERLEKLQDRLDQIETRLRKPEDIHRPILPKPLERVLEYAMPLLAFILFYYNRLVKDKDSSFWMVALSLVALSVIVIRVFTKHVTNSDQ